MVMRGLSKKPPLPIAIMIMRTLQERTSFRLVRKMPSRRLEMRRQKAKMSHSLAALGLKRLRKAVTVLLLRKRFSKNLSLQIGRVGFEFTVLFDLV